jgi:hypothetical protein
MPTEAPTKAPTKSPTTTPSEDPSVMPYQPDKLCPAQKERIIRHVDPMLP